MFALLMRREASSFCQSWNATEHQKFVAQTSSFHRSRSSGNTWCLFLVASKGVFIWHGATFAPEWVHSGYLSWLYICWHDTTTKCHAAASHPGVSSPWFLHPGENFAAIRNLAAVSCKGEKDHPFWCDIGLPVNWNGWRMRNVCDLESHVYFIKMKCTFK